MRIRSAFSVGVLLCRAVLLKCSLQHLPNKSQIMPSAAIWVDLEISILNQMEKDKYHMISLTSLILKYDTN